MKHHNFLREKVPSVPSLTHTAEVRSDERENPEFCYDFFSSQTRARAQLSRLEHSRQALFPVESQVVSRDSCHVFIARMIPPIKSYNDGKNHESCPIRRSVIAREL